MSAVDVVLRGTGGELDRVCVEVVGSPTDEALSDAIYETLATTGWVLSIGDTISIVERPS